ncbi:primosomal protein DnaI [Ornithinibacillus sp. 4-3]|uniref:Primosomal protein DnaI n=1 Tax=Ornithinibacillus sp. 4-3 TaxID=3231488 RepID=A0AB39HMU2_9BACI
MEPINTSLKKWMRENKNFAEQYEKLKQLVFNNPHIQTFLAEHPELSDKVIQRNMNKLYEYMSQTHNCEACSSLGTCKNILSGYYPVLYVQNNDIHLTYQKCQNKIADEQLKSQQQLVDSLAIPKEVLHAKMENIYQTPERLKVIPELVAFIEKAKTGTLPEKGMYLYGPFGVGKTYILGVIANRLKDLHYSSRLIYMPEFVREMREAINNDTLNAKINYYKTADALMLDDIGAETQSAWFRDEILGSILQYRMMEGLPVFFTSNYSVKELEKKLAETSRGGTETVKAGRIIERIKKVSKEIHLLGDNYRNEDGAE